MKKKTKKRILSRFDGKKQGWLHTALLVFITFLLAFAVFQTLFGVATVSGVSMEPNFHNGGVVLYRRHCRAYAVGDVVAVKMPSGEEYIKRVAALSGEEIDLRDGVFFRNGEPEAGNAGITRPQTDALSYPLQVEPGRYFVLGDNREASVDSRTFGTVSEGQILGKVIFVLKKGK